MNRIEVVSLFFNQIDKTKMSPTKAAEEFESFLLEEFLKEGMKPILEEKSFTQRIYWEQFLITVAEKLSEKEPLKFKKALKAYLKSSHNF
ncbi:MAG TPA: hypothetical protein EYH48_04970 [Aquifex aeolicus]|uniref:Uncharacterized protein n=1 Tax=Aquifex aeolicus TaxID=63363 RepID=A0A9D0YPS4_AQUAO|nr:hypothetical protein [Aquificales bacterium]HIP98652.1 hypothetical protein [Aquifex aeolicus]HIQ26660.1 hypothetical protein [Aquifex aeolicus]